MGLSDVLLDVCGGLTMRSQDQPNPCMHGLFDVRPVPHVCLHDTRCTGTPDRFDLCLHVCVCVCSCF